MLTRGEFLTLAQKAASVLASSGLSAGDCHVHFFSCNTLGDLAFRLASVMLGTVPVTINWQADTPERVVHKVRVTSSALVLVDDGTPADVQALLGAEVPAARIFNVADTATQPPLDPRRFCRHVAVSAPYSNSRPMLGPCGNPRPIWQLPAHTLAPHGR